MDTEQEKCYNCFMEGIGYGLTYPKYLQLQKKREGLGEECLWYGVIRRDVQKLLLSSDLECECLTFPEIAHKVADDIMENAVGIDEKI